MDIVVCTDKNYVMPCGVMLHSICCNNQETEISFHIIVDESVNSEAKQSLENVLFPKSSKKAFFYSINGNKYNYLPRLDETNPKKHITKAAYYRLYLAEILPNDIDKVLYLDCDTIVRHSLTNLWKTDLGNYSVGVVPDVGEGVIDKYNRLRYPQDKGYFNSGVLLINLKKWRKDQTRISFEHFIEEHPDWIKLHDQDVLNRFNYDDKKILPIMYNVQEGFLWKEMYYDYWKYEQEVLIARKDPVIIHYTDSKPWTEECTHPWKNIFINYLRETQWKNYPIYVKGYKLKVKKFKKRLRFVLEKFGVLTPHPVYQSPYIDMTNYLH